MRLLSGHFVSQFPERILNIHPSLLPAFPGLDAQYQALAHGVKIAGCTVHFVDENLDSGPILLQAAVPVFDDDTVEALVRANFGRGTPNLLRGHRLGAQRELPDRRPAGHKNLNTCLKRFLAVLASPQLVGLWVRSGFPGKRVDVETAQPVPAIGTVTPIVVRSGRSGTASNRSRPSVEQNGQANSSTKTRPSRGRRAECTTFTAGKKQAAFLQGRTGQARSSKPASNDLRGATQRPFARCSGRPETADHRRRWPAALHQSGRSGTRDARSRRQLDGSGRSCRPTIPRARFPCRAQPENSNHRFSLFPFPWDVSPDTIPLAFARNGAGTEVTTTFWVKVFPKKFRKSNIRAARQELQKVVGELDPDGTGSLIDRFVKLNRETARGQQPDTIYDLRKNTENRILWSGPFDAVKGARESYFADRRSYYYNGKKIDEQVHLGFDLAQTDQYAREGGQFREGDLRGPPRDLRQLRDPRSRLFARNPLWTHEQDRRESGRQGPKSSRSESADRPAWRSAITCTSACWLPAQVNPIEWWDEHWIHDRILSKIGSRRKGRA